MQVRQHGRRRCLACQQSADKAELLRFVWDGTAIAVDEKQRLPGRGAYLHRDCLLGKAVDARRWERALRLEPGSLGKEAAGAVRRLADALGTPPDAPAWRCSGPLRRGLPRRRP